VQRDRDSSRPGGHR